MSQLPNEDTGQQPVPLRIEDVLSANSFGLYTPVQISPHGKWVAYVMVDNRRIVLSSTKKRLETGIPQPPFAGDICLTDMTSGTTRCPTGEKSNNWAPAWSPDGRYLAFLSDQDGSGQAKIWVWEATTGQMRRLSDVSVRAEQIQWLSDSRRVLVTVLPEGLTPTEYSKHILGPASIDSETPNPSGSTVLVYRSTTAASDSLNEAKSPQFSLDNYLRDLAVITVSSGLVQRIDRGHRVARFSPAPDASRLAFTTPTRFAASATQQILFDLVTINIKTGQRQTASDIPLDYDGSSFSWSPDGFRLAFQTSSGQGKGACYIVEANGTNPPVRLTETLRQSPYRASAPLWDTNGRYIYFINGGALWQASVGGAKSAEVSSIANHTIFQLVGSADRVWISNENKSAIVLAQADDTKRSGFYSIDLESGKSSRLLEDGRCFTCAVENEWVNVTPNERNLVFFAGDAQHDTDLWLADAKFESVNRLTHLNPQFDKYLMGSSQLIEWRSLDGELLKGALLLPAGQVSGKRYPLIVNVYGGALHSSRLTHFGLGYAGTDNMQLFATRGYAVLLPDAPQHVGTPMLDLAKTVLPGVDKVIEMGIADPGRLGVMGHSYGGYSTLSLVVQTNRFKAAAMSDGTGDLVASYGEMHKDGSTYQVSIMETGQGLMGGTPWQFRDRYIENSPIFHLDRIETPLLIVHGAEDHAVASARGDEIFVGMRRLGKDVEYAKYEGEDHSPTYWSYPNQLDYCNRLIAWFDKHLKERP